MFSEHFDLPNFVPGQRWISETEPELGLGTVIDFEYNRVSILFIACSERRIYAADNAPLTRVFFGVGDKVESIDGWAIKVTHVEDKNGLLVYIGQTESGHEKKLEEVELNHFLQFNKPHERLFTGQIDTSSLFCLRYRTLQKIGQLERSPVRGLSGARASLIPHQLYIAHEVANRHAPRVLLADEVGLGKTIEAGLILHHQLLTNRAERVLVLVPEPLLHQWLVEMLRRFNLRFSLFDEERFDASNEGNPFHSEQLVLCGLNFFRENAKRQTQALEAGWDLCVVDEAHHLEWSEDAPSADYRFVEALAQVVPGILLLTATPEQLGKQSHFARLRLLDPDRFYSFEAFLAEEKQYEPLAELIEQLQGEASIAPNSLESLRQWLTHDKAEELLNRIEEPAAREELIQLLLDRHGTGRILFRNTRQTVKGFPERELQAHALPCPEAYDASCIHPEQNYRQSNGETAWWKIDSRIDWLIKTLKQIKPAKALVICALAKTAIDLEEALSHLGGIHAAVFHEGLSIVTRDRAAAWFADEEQGAQVLVCSEIGSEGRNFQFAHHLILFDLPLNPDQLEQRIGRLDRIGQSETIQIHVPYLENSAQASLFNWYHQGLNAFNAPCPAASAVFAKMKNELEDILQKQDETQLQELIDRAQKLNGQILSELHLGRDRLLELNSCRKQAADELAESVKQADHEGDLWPYLEEVFDNYGVDIEEHSENCLILMPGDHMRIPHFPGLSEEGATVTLARNIALAREDMLFLTWEHPMVRGTMDLILNSEHGNAAFSLIQHPQIAKGQLLLEAIYQVECAAPRRLNVGRFMHQSLLRLCINQSMKDFSQFDQESLFELRRQPDKAEIAELLRSQRKTITPMLHFVEQTAQKWLPKLIQESSKLMLESATGELKRLSALKKVNPYVRQEELDQLKQNALETHNHIQSSHLRLDAVRILLST